jgi:hypothetical protein
VASAAHGAKGLVGVFDEVTKAVGETRFGNGRSHGVQVATGHRTISRPRRV